MKFFNLMKGIFGKPTHAPEVEEAVSYQGIPEEATHPQDFATEIITSSREYVAPAPAPAPTDAQVDSEGSDMVLPLSSIVASFPVELQQRVKTEHIGLINVAFPLEVIMSQLAHGQVRFSFGNIRQAAPHAFTAGADRDSVMVTLPLGELVSRLQPALLGRRSVRQVEVPEEVASPFAGGGQGLSLGNRAAGRTPDTSLLSRPRAAQAARSVPPLADPRTRGNVTTFRKPSPPGGSAITPKSPLPMPQRPVPPAAPSGNGNGNGGHAAPPMPPARPATGRPVPGYNPLADALAKRGVEPTVPPKAVTPPAPKILPKQPDTSPLWISFNLVAENMPESLQLEISQYDLSAAKLALPGELVQAGLMRGKVAFTWKQLRGWIKPSPITEVSSHDSMIVNLPLSQIAPLFIGREKQPKPEGQKRLQVDESIPNLFFGFPQPEAAPTEPEPREIPVVPAPKQAETNYFVWDDVKEATAAEPEPEPTVQPVNPVPAARPAARPAKQPVSAGTTFASRKATPNDVVTKASLLEGVYGALVALPDGLLVASKLSPDVNGDAIAALIPQMYSKLSGCTKELRMGELNNLNFTVGNVPWKIFRVNGIFFAAYGCAGETLPGAHLAELAAELDYKKTL